jgi:hypothetical protein
MTTLFWIICLLVLSVALPLAGLGGLFVRTRREARMVRAAAESESGRVSAAQTTVIVELLGRAYVDRPGAVFRDFFFIALGLLAGAVAHIWSLFV